MLRITFNQITAEQPFHSGEPQRQRKNVLDAEDSQCNRTSTSIRSCLACALFLTMTSLAYSQNYTLGSQPNFQPQLPRQSAAPVPTSQPQSTGGLEGGNPFFGSIAQGTATTEVLPVSLTEAIARGLRYNLGSLLSDQNARATRGARLVALSRLLPNVNARISESSQQLSLLSFGLSGLPGVPSIIGPSGKDQSRQSAGLYILAALREALMTATHNVGYTTGNSTSAPFVELRQSLPSRAVAISSFVDQLMRFIGFFMEKSGTAKEAEEGIEIAIYEALANAVIHGNRENLEKQVHVVCRCNMDGEVLITVRDEGEGFDSRAVPDPTEAQRLLLPHGRGLHLMRAFMDEVSFEENGTVVLMRKRRKNPEPLAMHKGQNQGAA
jgi:serine/threonine-protein kinase RsbW